MTARDLRILCIAFGVLLTAVYFFVFLPTAFFRFDDFWQLNGSAVNAPGFLELVTSRNEADGRWQPGMRVVLWLIGSVAGTAHAWPYYLVLLCAHALNIFLAARLASAIGADDRGRMAAMFVGIAGLNFSAYALTSAFHLYGVLTMSFVLVAVLAAARYGRDRKPWRLAVVAAATLCGLLCKESAVVAPLLGAIAVRAATRGLRFGIRHWAGVVLAFAFAGAVFAGLQVAAGAPLIPERGRYAVSIGPHVGLSALWLLLHVSAWLLIPALIAWRQPEKRNAARQLMISAGLLLVVMMPTVLLPWRSPGHLYPLLFTTAVSAGLLVSASSAVRSRIRHAWTASAAGLVVVVAAIAMRHQILEWGPLTRQALADWQAQRAPEDRRVVWFDADWRQPYGGLADLIGPGIRLREALEVTTRGHIADAAICIPIVVGPAYVQQPGDALFLHAGGRLQRITAPPFAHATCLP